MRINSSLSPYHWSKADVIVLRDCGLKDGEIFEIKRVCFYFRHANRTVLGLGCITQGDITELSPNNSDDPYDCSDTSANLGNAVAF